MLLYVFQIIHMIKMCKGNLYTKLIVTDRILESGTKSHIYNYYIYILCSHIESAIYFPMYFMLLFGIHSGNS